MGTVWAYLRRAHTAGLSWPLPDELDDVRLEALLYPPLITTPESGRLLPDWLEVHPKLRRVPVFCECQRQSDNSSERRACLSPFGARTMVTILLPAN